MNNQRTLKSSPTHIYRAIFAIKTLPLGQQLRVTDLGHPDVFDDLESLRLVEGNGIGGTLVDWIPAHPLLLDDLRRLVSIFHLQNALPGTTNSVNRTTIALTAFPGDLTEYCLTLLVHLGWAIQMGCTWQLTEVGRTLATEFLVGANFVWPDAASRNATPTLLDTLLLLPYAGAPAHVIHQCYKSAAPIVYTIASLDELVKKGFVVRDKALTHTLTTAGKTKALEEYPTPPLAFPILAPRPAEVESTGVAGPFTMTITDTHRDALLLFLSNPHDRPLTRRAFISQWEDVLTSGNANTLLDDLIKLQLVLRVPLEGDYCLSRAGLDAARAHLKAKNEAAKPKSRAEDDWRVLEVFVDSVALRLGMFTPLALRAHTAAIRAPGSMDEATTRIINLTERGYLKDDKGVYSLTDLGEEALRSWLNYRGILKTPSDASSPSTPAQSTPMPEKPVSDELAKNMRRLTGRVGRLESEVEQIKKDVLTPSVCVDPWTALHTTPGARVRDYLTKSLESNPSLSDHWITPAEVVARLYAADNVKPSIDQVLASAKCHPSLRVFDDPKYPNVTLIALKNPRPAQYSEKFGNAVKVSGLVEEKPKQGANLKEVEKKILGLLKSQYVNALVAAEQRGEAWYCREVRVSVLSLASQTGVDVKSILQAIDSCKAIRWWSAPTGYRTSPENFRPEQGFAGFHGVPTLGDIRHWIADQAYAELKKHGANNYTLPFDGLAVALRMPGDTLKVSVKGDDRFYEWYRHVGSLVTSVVGLAAPPVNEAPKPTPKAPDLLDKLELVLAAKPNRCAPLVSVAAVVGEDPEAIRIRVKGNLRFHVWEGLTGTRIIPMIQLMGACSPRVAPTPPKPTRQRSLVEKVTYWLDTHTTGDKPFHSTMDVAHGALGGSKSDYFTILHILEKAARARNGVQVRLSRVNGLESFEWTWGPALAVLRKQTRDARCGIAHLLSAYPDTWFLVSDIAAKTGSSVVQIERALNLRRHDFPVATVAGDKTTKPTLYKWHLSTHGGGK